MNKSKGSQKIPITWNEDDHIAELQLVRSIPKVRLLKTGAEFRDGISYEQWLEIGVELAAMADGCQWWIGDWLVHGRAKFGDELYARAAALSGYESCSLADLVWVSGAFPRSLRNEKLSWSHHRFVASQPEEKRSELLKRAETEKLSAHDLRALVSEVENKPNQFFPARWISTGIEKLKALAQGPRRNEIKEALRPLVELYNTL